MKSALQALREIRARSAWPEPPTGADAEPGALGESSGSAPLDRFLADTTIPAAIYHSRALDRPFVLARDEAALPDLPRSLRSLVANPPDGEPRPIGGPPQGCRREVIEVAR